MNDPDIRALRRVFPVVLAIFAIGMSAHIYCIVVLVRSILAAS